MCLCHSVSKNGASMNEITIRNIVQLWQCYVVYLLAVPSQHLYRHLDTKDYCQRVLKTITILYSVSSYPNDMNTDWTNKRNKCCTLRLLVIVIISIACQYLKTGNNTLWLFILIRICIASCSSLIVRCSFVVRVLAKYRLIVEYNNWIESNPTTKYRW